MDFHGGEYKGRRGKRFQETHGMCNPIFTDFRNSRGGGGQTSYGNQNC